MTSLFKNLVHFIKLQIEEIEVNESLLLYGFFLTLTHIFTYLLWSPSGQNLTQVLKDPLTVCWTFYQSCHDSRSLFAQNIEVLLNLYLAFSLVVSILFLKKSMIKWAYSGLFLLTIFKYLVTIQDYRLMGNYHYMNFIVILFYLFIPQKIRMIKYLIVGFYLAAGILRFNADWLSGQTLGSQTLLEGKHLEFSMAYIIVLELCVSLLLIIRNNWLFWFGYIQFVIFHLASIYFVGFFFPLIMFCLLSLFVIEKLYPSKIKSSLSSRWGFSILAIFALAQIYPAVIYPQSAITGEGRIIAVNMFDARTTCENEMIIKFQGQTVEKSIPIPLIGARIHCDPNYYFHYVKNLCQQLKSEANFIDLDFNLRTKRTFDLNYISTLKAENFCTHPPKQSWLGVFTYE